MTLFYRHKKLLLLTQALFGLGLYSTVSLAQVPDSAEKIIPPPIVQENEYTILAVVVDHKLRSHGVFIVEQNGKYYLPVYDLAEIFQFFTNPVTNAKNLSGWINTPKNSFSIDKEKLTATKKKETTALPEHAFLADAQEYENILYMDIETLNHLWPVEMKVSLTTLTLDIESSTPLPFQIAQDRKKKQKRGLTKKNIFSDDDHIHPYKAEPYKSIGMPVVSLNSHVGYNEVSEKYETALAISGVQDLLGASADYSINFAKQTGRFKTPENLRLRFTRQNIHQGALPLGLETVQGGDVWLNNRDLVSHNLSGRGFVFDNIGYNRNSQFDNTTIEGIAIPGYEAELYRNGALLEVGIVNNNGEYRFEDVPLSYGNNKISVVLYGPQGQRQEINESYYIGGNMVKKGETQFKGGLVDSERDLISINERPTNRPLGVAANLEIFHGLTKKLSIFGSGSLTPTKKVGDKKYLSLGFISSAFNALSQVELYRDNDGGHALDTKILKRIGKNNLNLRLSLFDNFESQDNGFGQQARKIQAEARVQRRFQTAFGALGLEFNGRYRKKKNGVADTRLIARQSLSKNRARLSNTFTSSLFNKGTTRVDGRLTGTKRHKNWRFRGDVNYFVKPNWDISNIRGEVKYNLSDNYSTQASANYNLNTEETRSVLQITKNFKTFLGSAETDWSSKHGMGFMLRASTSFGPYGPNDRYIASSKPLNTASPILADIYHDVNYNDVYDAEDFPVPNAKLKLSSHTNKQGSNQYGRLDLINNHRNSPTRARVIQQTIEDPYLQPSIKGYTIFPRPGVAQKLSFPIVNTGALDATLINPQDGRPLSGINIILLDSKGHIVQTTHTAPDGYFTFEFLIPDQYTLKTSHIPTLGYFEKEISITPDNLFNFGIALSDQDLKKDPLIAALGDTRDMLQLLQKEQ